MLEQAKLIASSIAELVNQITLNLTILKIFRKT